MLYFEQVASGATTMAPETKAFAFGVALGGLIACTSVGIVVFGDRLKSVTASSEALKLVQPSDDGIPTGGLRTGSETNPGKTQDRLRK